MANSNTITDTRIANVSSIYALQQRARNFTHLTNNECIDAFLDSRNASSELVMVSSTVTSQSIRNGIESSLIEGFISGMDHDRWDAATNWVYDHDPANCTKELAMPSSDHWIVRGQQIQHCLVGPSGDNDSRCGLHFSKTIFIVIGICLLVEAFLISWVAILSESPTMVTLGDAQAEFLARPDQLTESTSERDADTQPKKRHFARLQIAEWRPVRRFWFNAVGPKMWIITVTLIFAALALGIQLYIMSLDSTRWRGHGTSLPDLWSYGVGRTNSFTLVEGFSFDRGTQYFVAHILFVNIFQLMISSLYLFYNNCLTCQVVAAQWTRFMTSTDGVPDRKPLRVSSHVGLQRTSYMLSLPWTYAFPLMIAFVCLHFLVARSVFLVRTTAYGPGPADQAQRIQSSDASRIGYSSMGILLVTLTGAISLLALVINSFRRYPAVPKHLPRLANKTAFISAACQRPKGDFEAYLFAVTLMAVDAEPDRTNGTEALLERVMFSTDRFSVPPEVGKKYLQPMPVDERDDWGWLMEGLGWVVRTGSSVVVKLRRRA
jgi:hypothetical protein